LTEGAVSGYEVQIQCKDGSRKWLSLSAQAVQNAAGELEYIDGVARDITERRDAEEALRRNERKFRTLVDSIHDGAFILNREGYFTFVNRAISERAGISEERFHRLHFYDIILPEFREAARAAFGKAIEGDGNFAVEFAYTGADGHIQYVETRATRILENGQIVGLQGVTHNITERRQAEEHLRQAHQELQQAHHDLEQRVRERTAELTEANRLLNEEIARRTLVEEALSESEQTLRAFLDALPEPALLLDNHDITSPPIRRWTRGWNARQNR
jgi:hypothetical protein